MAETFSGKVQIQNVSNNTTIELNGNNGDAIFKNAAGEEMLRIDGSEGDIRVKRKISGITREVFKLDASNAAMYIGSTSNEGDLIIRDNSGNDVFIFNGNSAALYIGSAGNEGDIQVRDSAGRTVFKFDGNSAALYIGSTGNEGDIQVRDSAGRTVFNFDGNSAALRVGANGNEGDIIVKDDNGNDSIHLNGGSGDIILRNADAAELFDVVNAEKVEPGMTMVLTDDGKLKPSSSPYDNKVIGVVAGAGNYRPGIILDQKNGNHNRMPVSIMGKVSCKVDATINPIEIGDLLTTSSTPGHAMKVTDYNKAMGSVIGKALNPILDGIGYVDMLVMQH